MSSKEKLWEKFEKFMDIGSNYWTDNYIDAEDHQKHHRNPGFGIGFAMVLMVSPELAYLHSKGSDTAMWLTGIGLFVAGVVLDMFFIYRPIYKKYPNELKKVDRYNCFIEVVISTALILFTVLRYKLGLYIG